GPVAEAAGNIARAAWEDVHGLDFATCTNEGHAATGLTDLESSLGELIDWRGAYLAFLPHGEPHWEPGHTDVDCTSGDQSRVIKLLGRRDLPETLFAGLGVAVIAHRPRSFVVSEDGSALLGLPVVATGRFKEQGIDHLYTHAFDHQFEVLEQVAVGRTE